MWFMLNTTFDEGKHLGHLDTLQSTYSVSYTLTGLSKRSSDTINSIAKTQTSFTTKLDLKSNYTWDSSSTISATGGTVTSATLSGTILTVVVGSVTGSVAIVAKATYTGGGSEGDDDTTDPTPDVPPTTGETVTFTLDTATTASTTEMVHTSQSIGSAVAYQEAGTKGVVTWDIPAYAIVTLTVATGGSYGMALTDRNNIVLASTPTANATDGTIVFPIQRVPTRVHASKAKFTSGSYTTYSEEEIKRMELPVGFTGNVTGQYVSTSQTVGSPIAFSNMSSASYTISNTIPANTQVTITCKETTAGGYGMALCDTSGNVIEYINHKDTASTDSKHTFTAQTVETKLYVSVNKFVSATYKFV